MRTTSLILGCTVLLVIAGACQKPADEAAPATEAPTAGSAPATSSASSTPSEETPTAPAPAATAAPAAPAAESVLASQETNWHGVVAEVTEFRRKGNTLTAKIRLRNQGGTDAQAEIKYDEVYLMDLAAGKKYKVLEDEGGSFIAALRSGWKDRWYDTLSPGQSQVLWMKFPAPPPEVKSVTLQVPSTPPFEDLAIQDS